MAISLKPTISAEEARSRLESILREIDDVGRDQFMTILSLSLSKQITQDEARDRLQDLLEEVEDIVLSKLVPLMDDLWDFSEIHPGMAGQLLEGLDEDVWWDVLESMSAYGRRAIDWLTSEEGLKLFRDRDQLEARAAALHARAVLLEEDGRQWLATRTRKRAKKLSQRAQKRREAEGAGS